MTATVHAPDRFCEHGTPAGSECGRCAALGEMGFPRNHFAGGISHLGHAQHTDGWCDECESYGCEGEYEHFHPETLFPTAVELGVPPVNPADGDLSRIRVLDRDSPEGQEELHKRAERKAKRDLVEGSVARLGAL